MGHRRNGRGARGKNDGGMVARVRIQTNQQRAVHNENVFIIIYNNNYNIMYILYAWYMARQYHYCCEPMTGFFGIGGPCGLRVEHASL